MKLRNLIKTISLFVVVFFSTTTIKGQGLNDVIEVYNEGAAEKYDNTSVKQNADIILVKAYNNLAGEYFSKDDYKGALASFDSVLMINPDYSSAMYNKALIYIIQANSDDFEKTIDQYIEKMKAGKDEAKVKQASTMALGYFRASGLKSDLANKLDEALSLLNDRQTIDYKILLSNFRVSIQNLKNH
jgi:tetratricopeptide (TPR) repeat protein